MQHVKEIADNGYTILPDVFLHSEVQELIEIIESADSNKTTFRKSSDLFAIRQFLIEMPKAIPLIFNKRLTELISMIFGEDFFLVKSLYFDKPGSSNWFVSYHQDLTISVKERFDIPDFGHWTVKQNQFSVQPPVDILEQNFTIRIHLDDTDATNGALRVIPGSHNKGIYRYENIDWSHQIEEICSVPKGGIMIMRPLLLHASNRSSGSSKRRVIHLEFSNKELPKPLSWSERISSTISA